MDMLYFVYSFTCLEALFFHFKLWKKLLWAFMYKPLYEHNFFLDKYLAELLLAHVETI